ncbi:MAG: hypothetical protein LDL41_12825 [Coleofasciculus sp. S288]|nr:hypothetical protein [Coleofasciculus sp. S288]
MDTINDFSNLQLGTNLAGIADWSTQYPFTNFFKNSRRWITHPESGKGWSTNEFDQLDLDENGYPKSLEGGEFVSVGSFFPNPPGFERYVVLYDGEGTFKFPLQGTIDESASKPGRLVVDVPDSKAIHFRITETDPNGTGDYIRNIRITPLEFENIVESQTFNPDFLKSLEGMKVLRFMDWMKTNNSEQGEWSTRPQLTDATWASDGVPLEVMVELANETGIDPWFNIPHLATDDYVRNFAQYVKDNLDPNLKPHVELSNEIWNRQFAQARYATEQGSGDYGKGLQWFGKRTAEITQIWDDVFGADQERVIGVMGTQAANPWTAEQALKPIQDAGLSYEEAGIDAVAIAPYFGLHLNDPNVQTMEQWTKQGMDFALDQLFKEITEGGVLPDGDEGGSIAKSADWIQSYVDLADRKGLELVAYEGGQHIAPLHNGMENNQAIVDLFIAANRDPRMGDAYKQYFQMWTDLTGDSLFANYTDIGQSGKWGSWGVRENLYQESSPKFDAVEEILESSIKGGFSDRPADNPGDDVTADPGSGLDSTGDGTDADNPVDTAAPSDGVGSDRGSETPTLDATIDGTGTGLKAEYFNNKDFTDLALTRTDATVDFDWGQDTPDAAIDADTFSVRWSGQVEPLYSETYTFSTLSDDGVRLWVNGELLIDDWRTFWNKENKGNITLEAGQKYDIQMEYFENQGGAVAQLSWESTSQKKEIIPQSQLYATLMSDDALNGSDEATPITGDFGNELLGVQVGGDTLIGANSDVAPPGSGERDRLLGSSEANIFALGDTNRVFYTGSGDLDYAQILDFDPSQKDRIQLKGIASDYSLQTFGGNTGIFLGSGDGAELIGIVEGVSLADFNSGFNFV